MPVLLGGLLCAGSLPAMAQITDGGFALTSTPTGGPTATPNTVYIIGDTITIAVNFTNDLVAPGSPTLRFDIGDQTRTTAPCVRDPQEDKRLLCSYVVQEGDTSDGSTNDGIRVPSGDQLLGGTPPDRGLAAEDVLDASPSVVDGVRLQLNGIAASGMLESGGTPVGFNAGRTIALMLTFGDGGSVAEEAMSNSGAMAATLVLENAERPARYVRTNAGIVTFHYTVVAGDNGAFGLKLSGVDALVDTNGNRGLATGWEKTIPREVADMESNQRRVDTRGPRVTQILFRGTTAEGTTPDRTTASSVPTAPVRDGWVFFDVFFDEPVVTGDTTLRVTVGQSTVSTATCLAVSAAPYSEWLRCNLEVDAGWLDTDGLSTPANPLNYTTLVDDLNNPATPAFASQRFPEIEVDAVPPTVSSATISVAKAEVASNVVVKVTFSEDVKAADRTSTATITIEGGAADRTATFWSVSGKIVEFRYALIAEDLAARTADNTSSTVKVSALAATNITDLADNPAGNDVTDTAAFKTGTTFNRKNVPTGSDAATVYADMTIPKLESISLGGDVRSVYGNAHEVTFEILFSESVTVGGAAQLAYKIGTTEFTSPISVPIDGSR